MRYDVQIFVSKILSPSFVVKFRNLKFQKILSRGIYRQKFANVEF